MVLCDRSPSADKRGMPLFTVYERASERLVVAWTYSRARVVLMVVTEDGRTRWRSFPDPAAFRSYWSGVESALQNAGWVRLQRQPEAELSPAPVRASARAMSDANRESTAGSQGGAPLPPGAAL